MTIAFDANIFIYSLDESETAKHPIALDCLSEGLLQADPPLLLWQVACETLAWLRRGEHQGRLTGQQVEDTIRDIIASYPLIGTDSSAFEIALDLHSRYSLSHWDSLLLAACITAGIDTLYSEDMAHGMTYDSIIVRNPFLPA